ncbi:hypothetical protein [Psychroserpens sp.]|uniref:PulJ/GspJ family protein n=1 Tax=Psychroserpens sp. TaxID=2020870 RepID=UPI002B26F35D|nr:hypothetical protein [Psychroserpens sp.]
MVILKKIRGSTLMETLVATVLIVIIFLISSMILNNVFSNSIKSNTQLIESHLNELQYLYVNEKLNTPYYETHGVWEITVVRFLDGNDYMIEIEAVNQTSSKSISQTNYEIK